MARPNRLLVDESVGGYHIISRTVGQERLLKEHDKDKFLDILFRFSKAYFVEIHSFCVMCNHFHLLVTMDTEYAPFISEKNLAERFWLATKGQYLKAEIETKIDWLNSFERDDVLERLCSISRFVGDVKQTFSRYYNREHKRSGHFWSERFKGVLVSHGFAQLYCSAYID
jgi:REP element-mobilizing transposase RayT